MTAKKTRDPGKIDPATGLYTELPSKRPEPTEADLRFQALARLPVETGLVGTVTGFWPEMGVGYVVVRINEEDVGSVRQIYSFTSNLIDLTGIYEGARVSFEANQWGSVTSFTVLQPEQNDAKADGNSL